MNIFREVKLRSAMPKDRITQCDWGDPTDVAFYMVDMRSTDRKRILDHLVPKRICPCCGTLKIRSKSWVVNKDKTAAVCRSCYMRKVPDRNLERNCKLQIRIFTETVIRYKIDPGKLSLARVELGMTAPEFAARAGWSSSYQYKIEGGVFNTLSAETAETIMEVLAQFGVYTEDEI